MSESQSDRTHGVGTQGVGTQERRLRARDLSSTHHEKRSEGTRSTKDLSRKMRVYGNLYFDTSLIPEGKVYAWKVATVGGVRTDTDYIGQAERDGWTKVPASRHPEYAVKEYVDGETRMPAHILVGGQFLMEKDKDDYDEERDYYAKVADEQLHRAKSLIREGNGIAKGTERSGRGAHFAD